MANSSIISTIKDKVIKEIINDDTIVMAIDAKEISVPDELINTHIFRFNQNPQKVQDATTFITIQVHLPSTYDDEKVWIKPVLEIWIYSQYDHMIINNIPQITASRNDYISQLLDLKFNGRTDFGFGELKLESNIEKAYNQYFVARQMVFETRDLNRGVCDRE